MDKSSYRQNRYARSYNDIPKSQTYITSLDGTPMIMLAQINFSEVPELEHYPTKGILQLFVHSTDWYNMERNDYKIIFHNSDNDYEQPSGTGTDRTKLENINGNLLIKIDNNYDQPKTLFSVTSNLSIFFYRRWSKNG